MTYRKFFRGLQSQSSYSQNLFFLTILGDFSENPLKTSKKHEKLLSAHVCKHIMRLRRRTMLPFALADRYDPKQLYKHTQWVLVTYRKIFRGLQSQSSCSQNLIF